MTESTSSLCRAERSRAAVGRRRAASIRSIDGVGRSTIAGMPLLRTASGIRPIWKLCGFVALVAIAFVVSGPVVGLLSTVFPASPQFLWPTTLTVLVLTVTWLCLHLERQGFREIGLAPTRRHILQAGAGFVVGAGVFSALAVVQAAAAGQTWTVNPDRVITTVLVGVVGVLVMVVLEEVLFRGYAFRRLRDIGGDRLALVVSSVVFGLWHLLGRPYWGMGAFFVAALPALGGLVFGYALLRSGSLLLPVGLHAGGNWASTSLFGWHMQSGQGAAPAPPTSLWTAPADQSTVNFVMSPDLLPHVPYIVAVVLLAGFVWRLCRPNAVLARPQL
jgi:membrane protease YdiL (CAAX protease family)